MVVVLDNVSRQSGSGTCPIRPVFLLRYFLDETTGRVKREGDILKRPELARTLKDVATYGAEALYNGTLGDQLVADIAKRGGIITKRDLEQYS